MAQKPLEACSMGELLFARHALHRLVQTLADYQIERLPQDQQEACWQAQRDAETRLQQIHAEIARRTVAEIDRQVREEPAESRPASPGHQDEFPESRFRLRKRGRS